MSVALGLHLKVDLEAFELNMAPVAVGHHVLVVRGELKKKKPLVASVKLQAFLAASSQQGLVQLQILVWLVDLQNV